MAQNLFQSTDIPLGARVEFFFQWSQWSTQLAMNAKMCHQLNQTDDQALNEQPFMNIPIKNQMQNFAFKYLQNILNSFKKTKVMTESLCKLLCDSVLQYCIEFKHDLTIPESSKLAQQI